MITRRLGEPATLLFLAATLLFGTYSVGIYIGNVKAPLYAIFSAPLLTFVFSFLFARALIGKRASWKMTALLIGLAILIGILLFRAMMAILMRILEWFFFFL